MLAQICRGTLWEAEQPGWRFGCWWGRQMLRNNTFPCTPEREKGLSQPYPGHLARAALSVLLRAGHLLTALLFPSTSQAHWEVPRWMCSKPFSSSPWLSFMYHQHCLSGFNFFVFPKSDLFLSYKALWLAQHRKHSGWICWSSYFICDWICICCFLCSACPLGCSLPRLNMSLATSSPVQQHLKPSLSRD